MEVTGDDVRRAFGDIGDHMVVEILSMGPSAADLQEVAAHLAQESDVMGELERPLTGRALRIYALLRTLDAQWEEDGGA